MSTHARATAALAPGVIEEPHRLTEEQCAVLLASGTIGRVGVTVGGLPMILPVDYASVDGDIVFRSGDDALLRSARAGAVIAFEIDGLHDVELRRWSVLIVGRATTVTDPDELERLRSGGPIPWVSGEHDHYVRLRPEMLSGFERPSH